MDSFTPGYLTLHKSGELTRRIELLDSLLSPCRLCPRGCGTERNTKSGVCETGNLPVAASSTPHFGEEPPISGFRGSGTIFLAHCNLRCVFCQNHDISQPPAAFSFPSETHEELATKMLALQERGCHNINWVSPTHQTAQLVRALGIAAERGLHLPIVYNSNGYDSFEVLQLLDGIVDIYMPDLKYSDSETGQRFSGVPEYVSVSRRALTEMYRQVGEGWVSNRGVLQKGLLVRLLVLPNGASGTEENLQWISEHLSPRVGVSLMSQYYPAHRAMNREYREVLGRTLHIDEWKRALQAHHKWLQGGKGYVQNARLSPDYYRPDFKNSERPFRDADDFTDE